MYALGADAFSRDMGIPDEKRWGISSKVLTNTNNGMYLLKHFQALFSTMALPTQISKPTGKGFSMSGEGVTATSSVVKSAGAAATDNAKKIAAREKARILMIELGEGRGRGCIWVYCLGRTEVKGRRE